MNEIHPNPQNPIPVGGVRPEHGGPRIVEHLEPLRPLAPTEPEITPDYWPDPSDRPSDPC